jgi:hypothetical protein
MSRACSRRRCRRLGRRRRRSARWTEGLRSALYHDSTANMLSPARRLNGRRSLGDARTCPSRVNAGVDAGGAAHPRADGALHRRHGSPDHSARRRPAGARLPPAGERAPVNRGAVVRATSSSPRRIAPRSRARSAASVVTYAPAVGETRPRVRGPVTGIFDEQYVLAKGARRRASRRSARRCSSASRTCRRTPRTTSRCSRSAASTYRVIERAARRHGRHRARASSLTKRPTLTVARFVILTAVDGAPAQAHPSGRRRAAVAANTAAGARVQGTRVDPWKKTQLPAISVYTLGEEVDETLEDAPRELTRTRSRSSAWIGRARPSAPRLTTRWTTSPSRSSAMDATRLARRHGTRPTDILEGTEMEVSREDDGRSDPLVGDRRAHLRGDVPDEAGAARATDDFLTVDATQKLVGGVAGHRRRGRPVHRPGATP